MELQKTCLNCFAQRGEYEVCPWCGHVAGTPNKPDYLLQPGMRLWGRYIIGTVLGIGGFGVTYKAFDTRLAAPVAIKEFFPQNLANRIPGDTKIRAFSGGDTEAYQLQLARFLDEAKNLARFAGGAHIVNVLDFFEDNATAYIVMEYLDGETLKQHLISRGGALPPAEAAGIMEGLLSALESIHQKGVIHRDISPDNLFILRGGQLKVLDFGAARFAAREDWTQSVVVKKGYAPAEQYRSNMKQGVWTDIYAAGATWYKMLSGQTPEESIERWEKDGLLRPSQCGAQVDENTDKTIMKAMALRPELRFKSAGAMLAALRGEGGAEYPEVEMKKRRRVRALSVVLSSVAALTALSIAGWQLGRGPRVINAGPTLADFDIEPDTITLLVPHGDPAYDTQVAMYENLAAAFTEQYPDYKVTIDARPYEELEANPPDYEEPGAPTVFQHSYGNAHEYLADLSPLVAGLNAADYYQMELVEDQYREDDGRILSIPTSFAFIAAWGSPSLAAEAGASLPERFTSFSQIMEAAAPAPGGLQLDVYVAMDLLSWYEPGGYENGQYRPEVWEADMRRYVRQRADVVNPDTYTRTYLDISQIYGGETVYIQQNLGSDAVLIPVEKKGGLNGYLTNVFHVNAAATENQQRVGMLFIHFLLSEYAQNVLHVQNRGSFPLNRTAMEQFFAAYPAYAALEPQFETIGSDGYIPHGLHDEMSRLLLGYNPATGERVDTVNEEEVMRLFMEYEPTEDD